MNRSTNIRSTRQSFLIGARDTLPLIIAAVPFAIVYGALAVSQGLSEWMIMGMSAIVFAGASQFVAVTLIASTIFFPVILLTVFIINLRHMLYSASLMPKLSSVSPWLRIPMAFWLTDETYAVVSHRFSRGSEQVSNQVQFTPFYLGSGIAMYSNWVFFSWIGMTLGQQIPDITSWGLDIAMVVAFVGIVVPHLKKRADWACALTAGISALLTYDWPHQTGLLFSSLIAIAVGVLVSNKSSKATSSGISGNRDV